MPTQHLPELAWHLFDEAGDDVLLLREHITDRTHATDGQFERAKGYIRDHVTRSARRSSPTAAAT
ncbi:hypothetical protein [Streptomyces sp. NPDC047315]|uniref:hypothetical protein n=1 Tax=Streptomyces sp. NPDC047315 TaxID=3155142 RepID=UPI0033C6574F